MALAPMLLGSGPLIGGVSALEGLGSSFIPSALGAAALAPLLGGVFGGGGGSPLQGSISQGVGGMLPPMPKMGDSGFHPFGSSGPRQQQQQSQSQQLGPFNDSFNPSATATSTSKSILNNIQFPQPSGIPTLPPFQMQTPMQAPRAQMQSPIPMQQGGGFSPMQAAQALGGLPMMMQQGGAQTPVMPQQMQQGQSAPLQGGVEQQGGGLPQMPGMPARGGGGGMLPSFNVGAGMQPSMQGTAQQAIQALPESEAAWRQSQQSPEQLFDQALKQPGQAAQPGALPAMPQVAPSRGGAPAPATAPERGTAAKAKPMTAGTTSGQRPIDKGFDNSIQELQSLAPQAAQSIKAATDRKRALDDATTQAFEGTRAQLQQKIAAAEDTLKGATPKSDAKTLAGKKNEILDEVLKGRSPEEQAAYRRARGGGSEQAPQGYRDKHPGVNMFLNALGAVGTTAAGLIEPGVASANVNARTARRAQRTADARAQQVNDRAIATSIEQEVRHLSTRQQTSEDKAGTIANEELTHAQSQLTHLDTMEHEQRTATATTVHNDLMADMHRIGVQSGIIEHVAGIYKDGLGLAHQDFMEGIASRHASADERRAATGEGNLEIREGEQSQVEQDRATAELTNLARAKSFLSGDVDPTTGKAKQSADQPLVDAINARVSRLGSVAPNLVSPPKPAAPVLPMPSGKGQHLSYDQAALYVQVAGNRAKAREMAREHGWSF